MLRRLLRGSSSRGLKEKGNEDKEKSKYHLPLTAEVRPCEWPSDAFLEAAKFMKISITWLRMQASPTSSTTSVISTSYSLILSCKNFIFMLGDHHLW